jgi:hypothetical protein
MEGLLGVEVAVEDGVEIQTDWCLSGIHGGSIRWLGVGVNRGLVGFWEEGNRKWAIGSGQWAMGNGQWAMGNGQWAMGNGQKALGSRD